MRIEIEYRYSGKPEVKINGKNVCVLSAEDWMSTRDGERYQTYELKIPQENEFVREFDLSFGQAIELAKKGKRIAREGWNGKNQYVVLACNISFKDNEGKLFNAEHEAIGNKAFAFVGTSGVQMGWLASQADMLAEDWKVVHVEES